MQCHAHTPHDMKLGVSGQEKEWAEKWERPSVEKCIQLTGYNSQHFHLSQRRSAYFYTAIQQNKRRMSFSSASMPPEVLILKSENIIVVLVSIYFLIYTYSICI